MILTLISCLIAYLLGWCAGYFSNKEQTEEIVQKIQKTPFIHHYTREERVIGAIPKKTAQQINERRDPVNRESIEAMRETLDNVPELVKAKETIQQQKKEEYGR